MQKQGPKLVHTVEELLRALLAQRQVPEGDLHDDWRSGCMHNRLQYH